MGDEHKISGKGDSLERFKFKVDNKSTKGIILAGGSGTRLHPITQVVSKQLLPIYNKPMIFYPLSLLIHAGIKDILIITTPTDKILFERLLNDGKDWGIKIDYAIQESPEGIAQAFIIANEWLGNSNSILILGDNIFHGPNLFDLITDAIQKNNGATIFGIEVDNPEQFGVINFDDNYNVLSIEEKPEQPKSKMIATGLYIYNQEAPFLASNLTKSMRGEYEITDLNNLYLEKNKLKVVILNNKYSWLDNGTHDSLLEASNFVKKNKINTL